MVPFTWRGGWLFKALSQETCSRTRFRYISTASTLTNAGPQRTVARPLKFEGIGLHSGNACIMTVLPAEANTGIVFRQDLAGFYDSDEQIGAVRASWENVIDTTLSTVIAGPPPNNIGRWSQRLGFQLQRLGLRSLGLRLCGPSFATIEHLMAALSSEQVDNVQIVLSSDELPVMDGSSSAFTAALSDPSAIIPCTGGAESAAEVVEIVRVVSVEERGGRSATLSPWHDSDRLQREELEICVEIDFGERIKEGAGGRQEFCFERGQFAQTVAAARTFCFEEDVERMRRMGLARGGSLENAVVYDRRGRVVNGEGLRFGDEAARHKALDAAGDLALAGRLVGRFRSVRPGHALSHRLLRTLFSDPRNFLRRPARKSPTVK